VKIKSLAEEARIIRKEEQKALGRRKSEDKRKDGRSNPAWYEFLGRDDAKYLSLRTHRTEDVRKEQRSSLLAYGFIRGRAYGPMEKPAADNPPDIARIASLVTKFGGQKVEKAVLQAWVTGTLTAHPFAKPKPVSAVA
jgi:hypothetical protein